MIAAGILLPVLSSCNATKYLKENEYLYKTSSVEFIDSIHAGVDSSKLKKELVALNKLRTNDKIFGLFPLKTSLYMLGERGFDDYIRYQEKYDTRFFFVFDYDKLLKKIDPIAEHDSKLRNWLRTTAGKEPQFIDSTLIDDTNLRISNYLYNRGFFHAASEYRVEVDTSKKNAEVIYTVQLNSLYKMHKVQYDISDKLLAKRITQIQTPSQLKTGQPIDVEILKSERNRITDNLRDIGYYKFQKEYIFFEVDTSSGTDSLDIYVKISMPAGDTVHHPYKIKAIYVYPNASRDYVENGLPERLFHYTDSTKIRRADKTKILKGYITADTSANSKVVLASLNDKHFSKEEEALLTEYVRRDTTHGKALYVDNKGKLKKVKRKKLRSDYYYSGNKRTYNPKAMGNNIFINPENYYSDSLIQKTIGAFSSVGIFKFVSVQAKESYDSTAFLRYLDLIIKLEPTDIRSFSAELNANTTADYLLGNAVNFSYTQRNLLHTLDQIKINIKGGIETQLGDVVFINTSELNAGVTLSIPQLGWPFKVEVPKRYYPQTNMALNFNYIDQINDFTLYSTTFEYSISVYENTRKKQHIFKFPVPSVNIVRVPRISDDFKAELAKNPLLNQSFQETVIMGYGYTFIYNSQAEGLHRWDNYLRASGEVNLPFSDFVKVDGDYRNYFTINKSNQFVVRVAAGIADPWNFGDSTIINTNVIPYVKQFFVGGAYSVRAFTVRKLGPGAFVDYDTTTGFRIDQVADMKIELSAEYRFDIFDPIKGAVFCDFGNTWTLKEDPYRPHANITWDFLNFMAIGPGIGLRLDLNYFVIRLDAAYPLYDPALDGPFRQEYFDYYESVGFEIPKKKVALNLAIGYPF